MQENLNLSDEQVSQIQEIQDRGGDRSEIKAVLTDEQSAQMKEMRKNRSGKKHKRAEE